MVTLFAELLTAGQENPKEPPIREPTPAPIRGGAK